MWSPPLMCRQTIRGITFIEICCDLSNANSHKIVRENFLYNVCLLLHHYIRPLFFCIAVWHGSRNKRSSPHPNLVAPPHVLRNGFALLLIHHGKDGCQQFGRKLRCINILFFKADANVQGFQFPNGFQAFLCVSGKPRRGLNQYFIDTSSTTVCQEPLEIVSFLG